MSREVKPPQTAPDRGDVNKGPYTCLLRSDPAQVAEETGIWPVLRFRSSALDLAQRHDEKRKGPNTCLFTPILRKSFRDMCLTPFCVFAGLFISAVAVKGHLPGGWKELFMTAEEQDRFRAQNGMRAAVGAGRKSFCPKQPGHQDRAVSSRCVSILCEGKDLSDSRGMKRD